MFPRKIPEKGVMYWDNADEILLYWSVAMWDYPLVFSDAQLHFTHSFNKLFQEKHRGLLFSHGIFTHDCQPSIQPCGI